MDNIIRHDRTLSIKGNFEGKKGYVCRVKHDFACVVFKGVWDYGVWVEIDTLKRVKRYTKEQEI